MSRRHLRTGLTRCTVNRPAFPEIVGLVARLVDLPEHEFNGQVTAQHVSAGIGHLQVDSRAIFYRAHPDDHRRLGAGEEVIKAVKQDKAKPLTLEKLKDEIINQVNNEQHGELELKETLQKINSVYLKRFGNYLLDFPQIVHDVIKMDRVSKATLQHLILTLQSIYKDQYEEAVEPKTTTAPLKNEHNLKQETADLLIKLLKQESSSVPDSQHNVENYKPVLVHPISQNSNQDLIDSIRYAAMVDK